MNENYTHPDMPVGVEDGIIKGMYLLTEGQDKAKQKVQLLGGGTILREVEAAAEILRKDYKVESDIWSLTSVNELRRDGLACEHWNLLNPGKDQKVPYVTAQLMGRQGPVICATDYIKSYGEQIRPYVDGRYVVLGTDGFGRSDTRAQLRRHFEVDRHFVVLAALKALADEGAIKMDVVTKAMKKFGISADKRDPMSC
jgi:pyruvate dehydrogenase E1 component